MAEIGKINTLRVVKELDFGFYLDGGEDGEILLPRRSSGAGCVIDEMIDVFIYLDSEDRIIATKEQPYAMVGDFAFLKVRTVDEYGAFLDWGLLKDLLVPFREQKQTMEEGKSYLVYIYIDEKSNRIAASAKIEKFLSDEPAEYTVGDEVDLIIVNQTEIGYKAIINEKHLGILYKNEVFQPLNRGQRIKGYIKKVREDEKIDLTIYKPGYEKVDELSQVILDYLKRNNGFGYVTDKSSSELIYELFNMSKKNFKKSVGALYKARLIQLEDDGIRLVKE